jgi:hypothetical protein
MLLSGVIPGISLLLVSVAYVGYFLSNLISDPSNLLLPMLWGLLLGILWLIWMHIPFLLIRLLRHRRSGR